MAKCAVNAQRKELSAHHLVKVTFRNSIENVKADLGRQKNKVFFLIYSNAQRKEKMTCKPNTSIITLNMNNINTI